MAFNNYKNIPGMPVSFKDGGSSLKSDSSAATTKSMLILGTAEDGPVLEPVAVDINTVKLFGKLKKSNGAPNNASLVRDFEQAWNSGCRDIRLMRVTGSEASYTLNTSESLATNTKKTEEIKGVVGGNDQTTFELVHSPIANSEKVYNKGSLITQGYTLNGTTLTIERNAADAGASISVTYDYYPTLNYNKTLVVAEGDTITLDHTPLADSLVLKFNGEALTVTTDYTIAGKVVTFVKAEIAQGDSIEVTYDYVSDRKLTISENNNNGLNYVTIYTNKVATLTNTPLANSVRVYIANKEVSNTNAYTVEGTTVTIDKKYFSRTDEVAISYLYEEVESFRSSIRLASGYGGEIYNQSKISIETISEQEESFFDKVIKITKPESKKLNAMEEPLTYKSSDFPTFMALVDAINNDPNNNVFRAFTDYPEALTSELENADAFLSGGDNGLNVTKQDIFDALAGSRDDNGYITKQGAYQILENYMVDIIVPGSVYADDYVAGRHKDFAYELALLCAILTNRTKTTLGAIAVKPCTDTSLMGVQKYTNKLLAYNNTYPMRDENGNLMLDSEGKSIDLGRYVHICVGPEPMIMNSELGMVIGNPAIQFAAELTKLPAQSSPLNKNIHGIKGLRYSYQTPQIDKLLGNRFIIFNTKMDKAGNKMNKMVDGITAAFPGSEYGRTTTLRCLQEIVDNFREVAEPFFGEPPSVENRNALASAISKRKDILVGQGVAEDIGFQLIVTPEDYLLGQATLEVDAVPPKEFRRINMVVGLKNTI